MAVFNVRDLLIDRLGVPLVPRFNAVSVLTTLPATRIIPANPTRAGFALVNGGSFVVFTQPSRQLSAVGFRIEPDGGALILNWEEDGELCNMEWTGMAVGGSAVVRSFETLIDAKAPRSPREEGG